MPLREEKSPYPEALYCPRCGEDVEPAIEPREAEYSHEERGRVVLPYLAAVCPVCGSTLCERDQEFAFLRYTKGADSHGREG